MRRFNVHTGALGAEEADPPGYKGSFARFGPQIGMEKLGATVYELPPGQSICPYHWEAGDEELLLVLNGRVAVRTPEGEEELEPGEMVCFPAGPAGAHKITNRSGEAIRLVMFSTMIEPAITIYPDSEKLGAFDKASGTRMLFRIGEEVDYYEGELT